ncbi:hypothetical protein MOTHE_c15600 [Moorella thermoacetica]|nr:hypothetical protein MOTHE_c15600 [Moorella thermoacetica]AKX96991.1 hypothetical protein MOTHA_c16450 [Moorella thermoacetica]OIQ54466.1 hypothetical protein MORE_14350 [Moorella thermoacetica]OIQ58162.1 hypothetical protein MOCA_05870 [Moorella thermoacetica]OIQ60237.1 hypothetical protein MTIN_20010 [Moorella thermoacetica]
MGAARVELEYEGFRKASRREPCPVCGKTDWCGFNSRSLSGITLPGCSWCRWANWPLLRVMCLKAPSLTLMQLQR